MKGRELVEMLLEGPTDARVYIDMTGNGGPYLELNDLLFYAYGGVNGEASYILKPRSDVARQAIRRQMAATFGDRVRRAITELTQVEAELI